MSEKNPKCHLEEGSMECLAVQWPDGHENLCMSCQWWLDQEPEEDDFDEEDNDGQ